VSDQHTIFSIASKLLAAAISEDEKVRLLGISISNFNEAEDPKASRQQQSGQLRLFP
jgi:hypothetical protein